MRRSRRDREKRSEDRTPEAAQGAGLDGSAVRSGGAARAASGRGARFEMTVGAFLARQRSGALHQGPRAELVDGTVTAGTLLDPSEAAALVNLSAAFATAKLAGLGVEALSWAPLRLGPVDLLRAAVALLPGPAFFDERDDGVQRLRHTRGAGVGIGGSYDPAGTLLVVETVRAGSEQHLRLGKYAAAGAREVWLLDVRRGWIESYRSPWRREYRSRTLWYPGESVPITALGDVAVEALVPP